MTPPAPAVLHLGGALHVTALAGEDEGLVRASVLEHEMQK
jgi:hypothetical protein